MPPARMNWSGGGHVVVPVRRFLRLSHVLKANTSRPPRNRAISTRIFGERILLVPRAVACARAHGMRVRVALPRRRNVSEGSGTTEASSAFPPCGRYTRSITKPVVLGSPGISGAVGTRGAMGSVLIEPARAARERRTV